METTQYIEVLRRLMRMAEDCQDSNIEEHEPAFFAVLVYILNASAPLKKAAELEFIEQIESKKSQPYQLVGYCVRKLQFPLLKEKVKTLMNEAHSKNDWRYIAVLNHILEDYDAKDDPEELYSYYRKTS